MGLAIFVAVGQLNKLFGVEKGEGNVFQKFFAVIRQLPEANWVTFAIGALSLALLFLTAALEQEDPGGFSGVVWFDRDQHRFQFECQLRR